MRRWVSLVLAVGGAACSRSSGVAPADVAPEGGAEARGVDGSAAPAVSAVSAASDAETTTRTTTRPPAGEAARVTLLHLEDEPLLSPALAKLRDHFGDARGPFVEQRTPLSNGWSAALVSLADESQPMVVAVDRDRLVWAKDKPTVGIVTPVGPLALVPYTDGGVALVSCVPGASLVAARVWADDANPFAELELLMGAACDAVSAAYWPGEGWVVVAARAGESRAQLLRESGSLAWGKDGVPWGAPWRAPAPATIVVDTPASVMLLQHGDAAGGGDHLVAQRYDPGGGALWAKPLDLGVVWHVSPSNEHVTATLARPGVVRVDLPHGVPTRTARAAELDSAGNVRWLASR
jgi:hypothetical protein